MSRKSRNKLARAQAPANPVLVSLEQKLQSAERRLMEHMAYADDMLAGWERERDEILNGNTLGGRRGARKDGDNWPYLRNMEDLIRMRQASREACEGNGYGAGMLDRAIDFVIGDGMQHEVTLIGPKKGAVATGIADADGDGRPDADPAVENVEQVIEEFRRLNDWGCGEEDREEEGFRRSQRDGEVFVRFFDGPASANGIPLVRWIEPEQVDAPSGEPQYRWGIKYKKGDVESKEAAWVVDMDGTDGDWVPWSELVFHKLGTDRTVLRGVPQFWLVARALYQSDALNSALAEVSAIQAKIAYVREHATGVMPGQINELVGGTLDGTGVKRTAYGDKYRRTGIQEEGTTVDMSAGMKFTAGPASTGVPAFVQALQSRLRQVCARFGYPEFFTGDASNNNYASSLTAGGPAERAFKRKQHRYASFQAAVYRRACEYAVRAGRLSAADLNAVEIKVKPGGVAIANKLEEAQVQQIRLQNKVLSVQSAMVENGADPKVEMANIKAFDDQFGMGAMGLGGGGGFDDGGQLIDPPTGESYTGEEYELLSEAQKSLLVKQIVTDKNGNKVTRWVSAGGEMGGKADASVQRAKMLTPGDAAKAAPKAKPDAPKPAASPKQPAKTRDQLTYLPKDPKRLNIDQAVRGLQDLGYTDVKWAGDVTHATGPDGERVSLRPVDIKRVLYGDTAVPKASRMRIEDLSRAYADAGGGRILGPAKGEPLQKPRAYRVKNPDGDGELVVKAGDILAAVVKAGLARESYRQDQYELLSEADRSHLVRKTITNSKGRKQVVWVRAGDDATGTHTRQQLADIRSIVAQAVANPNSLNPEQFAQLRAHLDTVNRDELRNLLRQVEAKVGGDKAALADRLAEKIKAGRTVGVGDALARGDAPRPNPRATVASPGIDLKQDRPDHPAAKAISDDAGTMKVLSDFRGEFSTTAMESKKAEIEGIHRQMVADIDVLAKQADVLADEIEPIRKKQYAPDTPDADRPALNDQVEALRAKRTALYEQADAIMADARAKRAAAEAEVASYTAKARARLVELIGVPAGERIKLKPTTDFKYPVLMKRAGVGAQAKGKVKASITTGGAWVASVTRHSGEAEYVIGTAKSGRAFYNDTPFGNLAHPAILTIASKHGGTEDGVAISAHEHGHLVEYRKPGVQEAAREFLDYRLNGEPQVPMSSKFVNYGYKSDETGAKDNFDRAFEGSAAYYVGKKYQRGSTEVISMGVEKLYRDPVKFAEADPEYFAFVVQQLRK